MTDEECARMLVSMQVRLLDRLRTKIDHHWFNFPVEEQDERQQGFEEGLRICLKELNTLKNDIVTGNGADS